MRKIVNVLAPIFICFLTGFVASKFQIESIRDWYPTLNKAPLNPPNYVFPIAWSILYSLMGLSIGLILNSKIENKFGYISLFALQLLLNFTWSISFFYLQNPTLGLINIVFLDIMVLYYIIKTYRKVLVSSLLFVPYFLWICFATYLNLYILFNN